MNAIAFDPTTFQFVDPFGGQKDIRDGIVRAVGDPRARFLEDGLRCMRAIRFGSTLGLEIETGTYSAISSSLESFRKVSMERIRDEMMKTLGGLSPMKSLLQMTETGMMAHFLPEVLEGLGMVQNRYHVFTVYGHILQAVKEAKPTPQARLAALMHDIGKPRTKTDHPERPGECQFLEHAEVGADMTVDILRRLKFDNETIDRTSRLVRHHMRWYNPKWSNGTVRRFVREVGEDLVQDLLDLQGADLIGHGTGREPRLEVEPLRERIAALGPPPVTTTLAVSGKDVMEILGIGPGPKVGMVLKNLLEAVTEDPTLNERATLIELMRPVPARKGDAP